MLPIRTLITCVDFSDFLALTLPYNRHHWKDVLVLTAPHDAETIKVAEANRAAVYATNTFYKNGARFNKFAALEEALDVFGRHGILALVDADIFWPKKLVHLNWVRGMLYSFKRRRLLLDVTQPIPPEEEWPKLPLDPQYGECLGFTQIFHADDYYHLGKPPWHRLDLEHAALGDCYFQMRWPHRNKMWLNYDVLHLGDYANNWIGRVVKHRDGRVPTHAEQRKTDLVILKDQLWPTRRPRGLTD